MAITAEMTTSVMELYTAYFNRAADKDGVDYWLNEMDTKAWTIDQVAQSFADQTEYTAIYAGLTNAQIVAQVYTNVLGRTADAEGAAYWEAELDAGTYPVSQFIQTVVNAATEVVDGVAVHATDKAIVDNKSAVSQYYYDNNRNDTNVSLTAVTADTATVTTATAALDAVIEAEAMANATQLTTSTDSFVGTAGNDVWNSTSGTLATADTILDSSSTDADVLYAEVTSNSAAPRLQNIETINITGKYTTAGLDLASVSGTTDLNVNTNILGGTATVTNASSLNALNINAGANVGTVSVTATASGTRDTAFVDAGSATTVTVAGGAGADTFDVTMAAGASATLNGGGSVDAYTVHVGSTATLTGNTATEAITINTDSDSVVTLGGALTDDVTTVPTAKTTVTGAGNVTIKGTNAQLTDTAIVNGGTGTLTVTVTNAAVAADLKAIVADTVNLAVDPTVGTVTVNEGSYVNLLADSTTTLEVDNAAGTLTTGTLLLNVSENSTSITTGSKVATLLISATPDEATDTDADGNGTSETHIVITTLDTATGTNTETVVISGSADLEIATFINDATASVLSASEMTGDLTIGTTSAAGTYVLGNGTNDITVGNVASTIHGGSGVDTITGGTAADTINGGAGNDVIAGGITGANTINAGAGDDTVIVTGAVTDTITLGAGSDTVKGAVNLNYTVSDISTTEDTLVITGAATTASDLTNVTPTSGAYKISNSGGVADFTLTGSTATDVSAFVQLGTSTAAYTAAAGLNVTAGAKNDVIAVSGANTIITGAGTDAVVVASTETTATVSDFTVGSDLVVIVGAAADGDSLDLSSVTPTSGAYTLSTNHVITLKNAGTALTNTDLSSMVQLGSAAVAFSLDNTSNAVGGISAQGGAANDYVDLGTIGTTATTYYFTDNGGVDTVTGVVANSALSAVSFTKITGITGTGTAVAANAAKISDAVDGSVYVFAAAADGTGSEAISTFTANADNGITADTILADVASFLNAGLGSTTGEKYVAVINDGTTQAYAYLVDGNTTGITASDITLIGIIDATAAAAITATDIA